MSDAFYFNLYAVPQFLVGFFMLAQGLVVLVQDYRSSLNRAFFLFELAVFVWLVGMGLAYISVGEEFGWLFSKIGFIGVTFIPITTYAFSLYYSGAAKQKPILIGGLLLTILLMLGLNFEVFTPGVYQYAWGYYIKLGLWGALPLLLFFLYVPLFCYNFYTKVKQSGLMNHKKWAAYALLAGFLAFFGVLDFLPAFGVIIPFPPLGYICVGVFATLMSYFILRYNLSDIKIIIGRTVGYIFLTGLIILFYTSLMLLIFGIENNQAGKIIIQALVFAGLLYIMGGLKEKTQRIIDQLFFKERIQFTQLIGEFVGNLSNLRTTKILAEFFLTFVVDKLRANFCALYIFDKNGGVWHIHRYFAGKKIEYLPNALPATISKADEATLRTFRKIAKGDITDAFRKGNKVLADAVSLILNDSQAEALFPIFRQESLECLVVLGRKQTGENYSLYEQNNLSKVFAPFGIAWVNSRQYEEIRAIDLTKNDFISILSHQLRTPLTRVRWAVEAIKKDDKKENNEFYYKEIANSLELLIDLTNLFTNMSTEDFSSQASKLNSDDLTKALNEILGQYGRLLKERNIAFEINLPSHFPTIVSDFFTFKTALAVILDNALRYTRAGGSANLTVKQDGNKLLILVKDNGVGIPEAEQYKIFSKFYRASNAAAVEPNGSGVALHYIRSLIERYGGAISFQSELGKGTIFNCTFKTI